MTYLTPCNPADPFQQWTFVGPAGKTVLRNSGSGKCIDAAGQWDPAQVTEAILSLRSHEARVSTPFPFASPLCAGFDLQPVLGNAAVGVHGCRAH